MTQGHFPTVKKFDFERDYPYFAQMEMDRFEQPMNRNQTIYLIKRYTTRYWYVIDITGNGMLDAYVISGKKDDATLHIFSIAVRKELEGEGWGRFLMNFLVDQARQDKIPVIRLEVKEDNSRAKAFYKRYGFIRKYMKHHYYGEDQHAIVMELELSDQKSKLGMLG